MRRAVLLPVLVLTLAAALRAAPAAAQQGVINLSCLEALGAIGESDLAGVFSFIAEKDSAAAFADLLARNPKALSKFIAKADKDLKAAGGISDWDKTVFQGIAALFASPLADTLPKLSAKTLSRLAELGAAPALPLQEITIRRRAGS